jgi:hypothetical protein
MDWMPWGNKGGQGNPMMSQAPVFPPSMGGFGNGGDPCASFEEAQPLRLMLLARWRSFRASNGASSSHGYAARRHALDGKSQVIEETSRA